MSDPCIKIDEIKEIKDKLVEHDNRIRDIESDKKLQMFQYQTIMDKLAQLDTKVEGILGKPSQYINIGIGAIITVIVTVLVTMVLNKLF